MKIAIYGGSFDPPHLGHAAAAMAAQRALEPDRFLIIPDCAAPHKQMAERGADPGQRLEMARLAFSGVPGVEVSDMEIRRGGKSYTSDTLRELLRDEPDAELYLVVGTDMLLSFKRWHEAEWMFGNVTLAVLPREKGAQELETVGRAAGALREGYGARVMVIDAEPIPAASTGVREALRRREGAELLDERVYAYIIKYRLYGAKPNFVWLREQAKTMLKPKRVPHVLGCEQEAVRLAGRWGADREDAAEAAILHDITKKFELNEQLLLCGEYGIIPDETERVSTKLLHAKTGAAIARERYGVSDAVYDAIRWHTTGKPDMSLLEEVIYMADYIEPTRSFEGVDELRRLAYEDLDRAMLLGLEMSLEEIADRGEKAHEATAAALEWYRKKVRSKG